MTDFITEIQASKKWDSFANWYNSLDPRERVSLPVFKGFVFAFQQGVFLRFLREQGINTEIALINTRDSNQEIILAHCFIAQHIASCQCIKTVNPDYDLGLQEAILKSFNL